MTDKKKYMDDEEFDDTQPTGGAMPIDVEQAKADAEREAMQNQLAEAQSKATEYKDRWLRAQAEFINYKNRMARDNEMM